jgi:integrase
MRPWHNRIRIGDGLEGLSALRDSTATPRTSIVAKKCPLAPVRMDRAVTPHVFRHTFITWRMAAGVTPFHISEVTGVSMQTLLRNYAHLMPVSGYDAMVSAKAKTISGARI